MDELEKLDLSQDGDRLCTLLASINTNVKPRVAELLVDHAADKEQAVAAIRQEVLALQGAGEYADRSIRQRLLQALERLDRDEAQRLKGIVGD